MYSNLGGTETLNFHRNYKVIQYKYLSLQALPRWVTQYIMKLGRVVEAFGQAGRQDLADEVKREVAKANDDLQKAWKVKQAIDKWGGVWSVASTYDPTALTVLSGLPKKQVPAEAFAALTWVVNHGMAVHQEYDTKRNVSEAAIKKAIEEDKDIEVPTIKEAIIKNVQYVIYGGAVLIALMAFMKARNV